MSQRTTRLRGPLAALLIALGVGAVLLVGEVACFSLHPGVASAANASHPRDLPEGEAVVASGPLTSDALADRLLSMLGGEDSALHFFDAAAPLVSFDSVDMDSG